MSKAITLSSKNIIGVFSEIREKLDRLKIPVDNRHMVMSIYMLWSLHDEGQQIYLEKARYLNKKHWRFKYKLLDRRTRGYKFLDRKFRQFKLDVAEGRIKVNREFLRII